MSELCSSWQLPLWWKLWWIWPLAILNNLREKGRVVPELCQSGGRCACVSLMSSLMLLLVWGAFQGWKHKWDDFWGNTTGPFYSGATLKMETVWLDLSITHGFVAEKKLCRPQHQGCWLADFWQKMMVCGATSNISQKFFIATTFSFFSTMWYKSNAPWMTSMVGAWYDGFDVIVKSLGNNI